MVAVQTKLRQAAEEYFSELRRIRGSGGATGERSMYPALAGLLNAIGGILNPVVFCVQELADQGSGHPDFGLYAAGQVQEGKPRSGQRPERGVVEVKPISEDAWVTADSAQVSRYWEGYRRVLATNARDFVVVGQDGEGNSIRLETFSLASSEDEFIKMLQHPRSFANDLGVRLGEYLLRVLGAEAVLTEPRDLAWLLASYARDALGRVEAAGDDGTLNFVRDSLEQSLGVKFDDELGLAFFRSTLVQTLFYGVFSAWVLWAGGNPAANARFRWREEVWSLRAPVLRELFFQLGNPAALQEVGLVEVMDWAENALNRVDRKTFFTKFNEGEAVPYFYEPFLEEFDPELRERLGVWYTPTELVRYMVARVDMSLKEDLGIPEGLAGEQVFVLDPCCGTGAYLAEVLRRISANLERAGSGVLKGERIRRAATERVFGFEIMPAPFVVAHLQVGLTLQELDAALSDASGQRAGVYLTNALTGWEPSDQEPLPLAELEEERKQADRVKQDTPVLVILGNPPYNGFAGVAVEQERELSEAYRATERVRSPEGRGLNDLYVRFFRMAERRIVEKTGQGVVCFISNYSWLDGSSFTGMRERYLEAFDVIRIDNLHGDRNISEYAPDGRTSETVMAVQGQSSGIRVGTSVAMLSRSSAPRDESKGVLYRDFHQARASDRRKAMLDSLESEDIDSGYTRLDCDMSLGLPFKPTAVGADWQNWPALPDLFPLSFPGVKTSRDGFLVDVDLERLRGRMTDYFDGDLSHDEIAERYPRVMESTARFDARKVRELLVRRGGPKEDGFVRHSYRPFDNRWLYWESETKLLDEKRATYKPHVFEGNLWLGSNKREIDEEFSNGIVVPHLGNLKLSNWGIQFFPLLVRDEMLGLVGDPTQRRWNLTVAAEKYLDTIGLSAEDLFYYVVATMHGRDYRTANAGALRMGWPRIPIPGWCDGGDVVGSAEELSASAALGREMVALLDSDIPVGGVTAGAVRPELVRLAVATTTDGANMVSDDFGVSAGWGRSGPSGVVSPGKGRVVERSYDLHDGAGLDDAAQIFGDTTFDVYLNEKAYWRNVPAPVWNYKLGGYQVLKKWLSYREQKVLGRPLQWDEVQHFTDTARRISAILMLVG